MVLLSYFQYLLMITFDFFKDFRIIKLGPIGRAIALDDMDCDLRDRQ